MRRRPRNAARSELNTSSMFDMAFQLLTFFILTFKPTPIEGQISLRLPEAAPTSDPRAVVRAGDDTSISDVVKGVETLTLSVVPVGGSVDYLVGDRRLHTAPALENELEKIFADKGNPFEQVIVRVGAEVRYRDLMRVIECCTRQRLPAGSRLSKLSFVEIPPGGDE